MQFMQASDHATVRAFSCTAHRFRRRYKKFIKDHYTYVKHPSSTVAITSRVDLARIHGIIRAPSSYELRAATYNRRSPRQLGVFITTFPRDNLQYHIVQEHRRCGERISTNRLIAPNVREQWCLIILARRQLNLLIYRAPESRRDQHGRRCWNITRGYTSMDLGSQFARPWTFAYDYRRSKWTYSCLDKCPEDANDVVRAIWESNPLVRMAAYLSEIELKQYD
jgi:hypothetical protein